MIRVPEIRVIDAEGEQLGVMATDNALALADDQGLDLVEVSPTARPPVCRIMDFGKFKYEQNKRQRETRKKQHTIQVKEVKFRPKTEEHDYQFKKRHAEEFLEKGYKVKVTMMFRGRELDHRDLGMRMLHRLEEDLAETGTVERAAKFEGRLIVMYMAPTSVVPKKQKSSKPKPKKTEEPKTTEETETPATTDTPETPQTPEVTETAETLKTKESTPSAEATAEQTQTTEEGKDAET
jgi:translation initiation factor IF-3